MYVDTALMINCTDQQSFSGYQPRFSQRSIVCCCFIVSVIKTSRYRYGHDTVMGRCMYILTNKYTCSVPGEQRLNTQNENTSTRKGKKEKKNYTNRTVRPFCGLLKVKESKYNTELIFCYFGMSACVSCVLVILYPFILFRHTDNHYYGATIMI